MDHLSQLLLGRQGVSVGALADGNYGVNDVAALFGNSDVLTGGDENFTLAGITSNSTVTLGNGADAVGLVGDYNIVTLGDLQISSVTGLADAADQVVLAGSHNSLNVFGAANVQLSGTDNSMSFTDPELLTGPFALKSSPTDNNRAADLVNVSITGTGDHVVEAGDSFYASIADTSAINITGGAGSNYVDVKTSGIINLDGQQNTIIVGSAAGGHFDITAGSGWDYVLLTDVANPSGQSTLADDVVHLAGVGNQVTGGTTATITGGSGSAILNLGSTNPSDQHDSSFQIGIGGTKNAISIQNAIYSTVDAGSSSDTVSLLNSAGTFTFHGAADMLFIGESSAPTTVNDQSVGLQIHVSSSTDLEPLIVNGSDRSVMIDFAPGTNGFTSVNQIAQQLHSDGNGGTVLTVASSASSPALIDFTSDSHISAANFKIA